MAITIDWPNKIIHVPQSFLNWMGGSIYQLDTDAFRIALKEQEESELGIMYPVTHNHNTAVLLGGIQYARVIEITNGYTITFENDSYVVNLIGSNNNVLDVTNLNLVQVRSNNSAGLINVRELQHGSFNDGVRVDVVNGLSGQTYPIGTPLSPSNNFADAKAIASSRGFDTLYVSKTCTLGAEADLDGFVLKGRSSVLTGLTIQSAANVLNCTITDCVVSGVLDGGTMLENCTANNLTYINGVVQKCMLNPATISLGGDSTNEAHFIDCFAGRAGGPIIDCAGDGPTLLVRNYNGTLTITNKTGSAPVVVDLNSGKVILDDTVTSGHIIVRGLGELVDILGNVIESGSWNGCTIDNDTVTSNADIAAAVLAEILASQGIPVDAGAVWTDPNALTVGKFIALSD